MANITIRNLDDSLKSRLRVRAARNGRSMEDEARDILCRGLAEETQPPQNLADVIRSRFAPLGGVELSIPPREPPREPLAQHAVTDCAHSGLQRHESHDT